MGCLFAARLSGLVDVRMFGHWKDQLTAISKQGLLLYHYDGSQHRYPVIATDEIPDPNIFDIVLILVKGWQTQEAAVISKKLVRENGLTITLQNGLGNLEILANKLGKETVIQGVTSEGATLISPGIVRHAGAGVTYLAKANNANSQLHEISHIFGSAGFETHLIQDADGLIWGKLAVNAGINPLTGLLQVPNGLLAHDGIAKTLMWMAAKEVEALAQAQHIVLPFPDAAEQALKVAKATANNRSSMAQDIARGAPTEIDSICGAIVRSGQKWQVSTPVNQALLKLVTYQIEHGNWLDKIDNVSQEVREKFRSLAFEYQEIKR